MATSYRTSTMARTMSRRTFVVRRCIIVVRHVVVVVSSSTHRTTKIQRRTIKVRQHRTTNFVRCHRTASYDRTTACGDFIVLLRLFYDRTMTSYDRLCRVCGDPYTLP